MAKKVGVLVDASVQLGELFHHWNYIGYDECNYTHTPSGEALLKKFSRLGEKKPYYVRAHHLFCTGNGHTYSYKWGSTNIYLEDEKQNAIYGFDTFDKILDSILKSGNKPFVEMGFTPLDLLDTSYIPEDKRGAPVSYREYEIKYRACPPKDYNRWRELIARMLNHLLEKYGREELSTWYFELWNEPDGAYYWLGSIADYCKLYDYTLAAFEEFFPDATIGGPGTCGPHRGAYSEKFLHEFLNHCRSGTNYVTGKTGARIDYVSFHAKGGGFPHDFLRKKRGSPSVRYLLSQIELGMEILERNGYQNLEVVLSECDPDGWAGGGMHDNINMTYRNTSYYASYVASSFALIEDFASEKGYDIRPLTWAFVFPGERCFEGTRTFQTQGIDKPIFNLFKMYGKIGDRKISLVCNAGPEDSDFIGGFAAITGNKSLEILLYHHHDDQWSAGGLAQIDLEINNLPFADESVRISHYRIDQNHSNAFTVWQKMGSPDYPDEKTKTHLKTRDDLELLNPPRDEVSHHGGLKLELNLPTHGISLLVLEPGRRA